MLAVGGLCCHFFFGLGSGRGWTLWYMLFAVCALNLLVGVTLSGYFCRTKYSPRRFMAWLLLWTALAVPIAGVPAVAVTLAFVESYDPVEFLTVIVSALLPLLSMSFFLGGAVYLMNLPFMFLAHRSAFYRDRFYHAVGVPHPAGEGECPFAREMRIEAEQNGQRE
jgi:hypothetical protein